MPRVTVITATYNWAPVLPHAMASVLEQTFADLELWVVGDGCTDESEAVVAAVADPRVHWHNLPANTGHQSGPNNAGLERASGDVVAYLGHDDLWLPHHLEVLVAALDDTSAVLVHGSTLLVHLDEAPKVFPEAGWSFRPGVWMPPTTVLHRREVIDRVGGWMSPSAVAAGDPESHLWRRMAEVAPPVHVDRLTSIKLSAAHRRNVYRDRPDHEQAWWRARLQAAPDPEAEARAAADRPYELGIAPQPPWQPMGERAGWAVRTRWRRLRGRPPVTSAERLSLRRRYKGLDPAPGAGRTDPGRG